MLQINPKKFKNIQNKTIPLPIRPKFRNSGKTSIYFLSKRRVENKKKVSLINKIRFILFILIIGVFGYLFSS